jgi:hypothetical protein
MVVPLVTALPRAACALAMASDMTLSAAGSRPDPVCAVPGQRQPPDRSGLRRLVRGEFIVINGRPTRHQL